MRPRDRDLMEVGCLTDQTSRLHGILENRVVGQEAAVEALTCSFSRLLSGLRDPNRPVFTTLLLGPTGVGKTETARALAETLFGWDQALTRINCEEYAHGHELAKLLGSPPGYVGQGIEPLLSQRRIHSPHRRAAAEGTGMFGEGSARLRDLFPAEVSHCLSVLLFDEIEKAHPVLWNALLGILEEGTLTLGDNSSTDFTRSIIVMTSNVGSRDLEQLLRAHPVGFHQDGASEPQRLDFGATALGAARAVFPPEFLNRCDEILVYSPLRREHLERIFDKFLADIHARAMNQAGVPLLVMVSPQARGLILDRGSDLRFGARPLRRAMESELVDPLSRLIASRQLAPGDVVEVECAGDRVVFYRNRRAQAALASSDVGR